MELADLSRGMRKDNFSEPETLFFLQSRACLMGWFGDRERRVATSHF